jgi:hypothetical protein
MFTYLWNVIHKNLVVKPVGMNIFCLLGTSWSTVDVSPFWCVVILSVYLMLNFVNSSLAVGTFQSVCNTLLDIHRGAFDVARRALFRYLCNISVFVLLAVPQRGTPRVPMGFRIVLYISNLFPIANSDFVYYWVLDFKLSLCSVLTVLTFGCFSSVWFILADVSEPSCQVHLQRWPTFRNPLSGPSSKAWCIPASDLYWPTFQNPLVRSIFKGLVYSGVWFILADVSEPCARSIFKGLVYSGVWFILADV